MSQIFLWSFSSSSSDKTSLHGLFVPKSSLRFWALVLGFGVCCLWALAIFFKFPLLGPRGVHGDLLV